MDIIQIWIAKFVYTKLIQVVGKAVKYGIDICKTNSARETVVIFAFCCQQM